MHLKLLSTQGTGADKLLSTQRVKENSEEIINRNRDDLQKPWQHRLKIIHTNVNQNNQAMALNQTIDTDHRP